MVKGLCPSERSYPGGAYEIIKRLEQNGETALLQKLSNHVEAKRKANKKLHEVWELSFDWKECRSWEFINQKLSYIHDNPCSKKWNLYPSPVKYLHSSAKFYGNGRCAVYKKKQFFVTDATSLANIQIWGETLLKKRY